jgi:hypothetical protein
MAKSGRLYMVNVYLVCLSGIIAFISYHLDSLRQQYFAIVPEQQQTMSLIVNKSAVPRFSKGVYL